MLANDRYSQDYIDDARARVRAQVDAFRSVAGARAAASADLNTDKAFAALEAAFFNNMVITLESYFRDRTRGLEKKDGNPLNEVRVLTHSMLQNGEVFMANAIGMNPDKSVLGYEVGDKIRIQEAEFSQLAEAFFAEIEAKFGPK